MAVEKSIDLTATGPTLDEAITEAVERARLTLRGLTSFEVERIEGLIGEDGFEYRVLVRISFQIKEQLHE